MRQVPNYSKSDWAPIMLVSSCEIAQPVRIATEKVIDLLEAAEKRQPKIQTRFDSSIQEIYRKAS